MRSILLALQNNERNRSENRNEVKRQVHDVPDDSRWGEFRKWLASQFAESRNHIASTTAFDLALLGHKLGVSAFDECAIKGVDQAVLDEERFGEDHCQSAGLAEDQQSSRDGSEWARSEEHHGGLRDVGEKEHEGRNTHAQGEGRCKLVEKRRPEAAV